MRQRRVAIAALAALLSALTVAVPLQASAHDLRHETSSRAGTVVRVFYPDGSGFSFEAYEVYRVGEDAPLQVGRTDGEGRLVFLPDRPGRFRVKAFSEDGHGVDFEIDATPQGDVTDRGRPVYDRYMRIMTGAGILLGLFGVLSILYRRKR